MAGPGQDAGEQSLQRMVTACVGMLLTVQKCTVADPVVMPQTVERSLEHALRALRPKAESNQALFQELEGAMRTLQGLLAR